MADPLFYLDGIVHAYGGLAALRVNDLSLFEGSITGLAGPNGSGKSTFLSILGLVLKPSSGVVRFRGMAVAPFTRRARHCIALLPQDACLLNRSVFHNVAHGLKLRKDTENLERRVAEALEAVGLPPEDFAPRFSHQLSGGEARRVALAARLILKPDVLLLDEPTSQVDEHSSRMIRKAMVLARDSWKTTLVVSSHDTEWLLTICDRVLGFFKGQIDQESRMNIIYGPFEPFQDGFYRSRSEVGDSPWVVPPPPHEQAAALLPARRLSLCLKNDGLPEGVLSQDVVITGKHLDGDTANILVVMKHNDRVLFASLDREKARDLQPGDKVIAYYLPEHIQFR